ncbi:hypothetical protein O6H91_02G146200 [Diphasiastrum complanatum]|uniref:Uncharacterized protein n=1 Tax=Diphasiastrum complanatum TaxID=34168 RepID=A0ACC2ELU7_DIPCM|nr:hypothetical protein O6H91_02G146200 [Diphasiastrum complanatum]
MAEVVNASADNFEVALKDSEQRSQQGSAILLLLFLADHDAALGRSWCPDCVRAEPVINKAIESSSRKGRTVRLLRVYVGDRPTWRSPSHPLRIDRRLQLKGVPTLIRWENGSIIGRLEDYEAHLENKIEELLS